MFFWCFQNEWQGNIELQCVKKANNLNNQQIVEKHETSAVFLLLLHGQVSWTYDSYIFFSPLYRQWPSFSFFNFVLSWRDPVKIRRPAPCFLSKPILLLFIFLLFCDNPRLTWVCWNHCIYTTWQCSHFMFPFLSRNKYISTVAQDRKS